MANSILICRAVAFVISILAFLPASLGQCNEFLSGTCCGDVNGDGSVTAADVRLVEADLGCEGCCVADLNWDGIVDCFDIEIVEGELKDECAGYRALPLVVWDPNCYSSCDPDCQAAAGCVPLRATAQVSTVSFADLDADGWPDVATWAGDTADLSRRRLYRNGGGIPLTWFEADLDPAISNPDLAIGWRSGYGTHLGDINDDGYPDYVPSRSIYEPEPDEPERIWGLYLNTGDPNSYFVSVAGCLDIANAGLSEPETNTFGDVDGDGDIDIFLPSYEADNSNPDPNDLPGNRLLVNLGTDSHDPNDPNNSCPAGPPIALEMDPNLTIDANLQDYGTDPNELDTYFLRPEGVQLVDYDYDGDLDFFFSDHVWQNVTTLDDTPRFRRLDLNHSGVLVRGEPGSNAWPEEGLLVADFDMDGDLDLLRNMKQNGPPLLNPSRGDGTFQNDYVIGNADGFGTSSADWDNDGDLDVTAGGFFLRNKTVEGVAGGFAQLGCVTDPFCGEHKYGLPAWADVDRDGDLDCAFGGWGTGSLKGRFYRNHIYLENCGVCDEWAKRYVNIRPVRAAVAANGPKGNERDYTENEFGARVELVVRTDPNGYSTGLRRVQVTSPAGGYLNQNEYLLHFGLPSDPEPKDPNEDLRFDIYVDFPTRADEPLHAPWRVDWTVNSQLKDINLADLYEDCCDASTLGRPITVYRDGRVQFKGADPNSIDDPNVARLYTLGGALRLPDPTDPNAALPVPTSGNVFAGMRFVTEPNFPEMRIREIIVDGQLDQTTSGCAYNVVVLDVTDPNLKVVKGGLKARTFTGNHRTFIHVPPPDPNAPDFVLPRNTSVTTRTYEVRARLTSYDPTERPDPNGLLASYHVRVDKGLNTVNSFAAVGTLCTQTMTLRSDTKTPITVRLSPTGN